MSSESQWSIEAPGVQGRLRVYEPSQVEVLAAAPLLSDFNNDSHNSAMMTNTHELTAVEVVEIFQSLRAGGGRPFFLEQDGVLMGDADFRHVAGLDAEFAIMIGKRAQQSRGLGTRFSAMMHVAARRVLGFERVYATIIPINIASRRMLEKLGYKLDKSSRAAAFAEAEDDIVMSIDWAEFERVHAEFLAQVVITARTT